MKIAKEPIEFIITPVQSGNRIDKLLAFINPEYSRSYVKKLILQGFYFSYDYDLTNQLQNQ